MARQPSKTTDAKTERVSMALSNNVAAGARQAATDLGMSLNAWLGMAVGRAVRAHEMERDVLEKVLKETFGEQLRLQLAEMEGALREHLT